MRRVWQAGNNCDGCGRRGMIATGVAGGERLRPRKNRDAPTACKTQATRSISGRVSSTACASNRPSSSSRSPPISCACRRATQIAQEGTMSLRVAWLILPPASSPPPVQPSPLANLIDAIDAIFDSMVRNGDSCMAVDLGTLFSPALLTCRCYAKEPFSTAHAIA